MKLVWGNKLSILGYLPLSSVLKHSSVFLQTNEIPNQGCCSWCIYRKSVLGAVQSHMK